MTLTEQLYEGTLPTGWYYFNNGVETYIVLYSNANTKDRKLQEPEGITVLCKVPSYEDWIITEDEAKYYFEAQNYFANLAVDESMEKDKIKLDCKALAKLVLKLSPERKEWLEKHYGEYL
jgi:hypothetical protein